MSTDNAVSGQIKIGEHASDGTIYAGRSPDTGKPMFTTPADAPLTYTFQQAQNYAAELEAHGHKDWRVPSKGELAELFNNRAAIWDYDNSPAFSLKYHAARFLALLYNDREILEHLKSIPTNWYWSSTPASDEMSWAERFSGGYQSAIDRSFASSLRCIRT
jgi:hypothetical protein